MFILLYFFLLLIFFLLCILIFFFFFFFFFQAEDGIRDGHVTGDQTCALPIWKSSQINLDDNSCSLQIYFFLLFCRLVIWPKCVISPTPISNSLSPTLESR